MALCGEVLAKLKSPEVRPMQDNLWRAIVEGHYSPVESIINDRRVLALRPNEDPAIRAKVALTARERKLVSFMCRGYSGKAIALEIGMSEATVSGTLRTAAQKLGARSRLDLVRVLSTMARQNAQILRDAVAMTTERAA